MRCISPTPRFAVLAAAALGLSLLGQLAMPATPATVDWSCFEAKVQALLRSREASPLIMIEGTYPDFTVDGIPAKRLVSKPDEPFLTGAQNEGIFLYEDAEGVHHLLKVFYTAANVEGRVRGSVMHQELGGPQIFRMGWAHLPDGRVLPCIDRVELFHGEKVATLQGLATRSKQDPSVFRRFYEGTPERRLTREMARLVVHAGINQVVLSDPDFIFAGNSVELIDPDYWFQSPDALFKSVSKAADTVVLQAKADPQMAAAFIQDLKTELESATPRPSDGAIDAALQMPRHLLLWQLLGNRLGVRLETQGVMMSFDKEATLLGSTPRFEVIPGDEIAAIDGKPAIAPDAYDAIAMMKDGPHRFTLLRGHEKIEVTVEIRSPH